MTHLVNSSFQSLHFQTQAVRTYADEKGELWFLANDVCAILGYANPRDAISKHCKNKGVAKRDTPTESGNQSMTYINEPNLYRLIIKSRKPEAEAFEAWVMEEVLPAIRKTGRYEAPRPSTIAERAGIREAVAMLVQKSALDYAEVYRMLHQRFHIEHLEDLSAAQVAEVVEYVHGLVLQAEQTEALPQLTARDYFVSLAKMTGFAQQYHEMQKALSAHNNPGGEFEKIFRGWLAAVPNSKHKDGYLFLFESSIEDDIKQAYTCLKQQSRLLAGAVSC